MATAVFHSIPLTEVYRSRQTFDEIIINEHRFSNSISNRRLYEKQPMTAQADLNSFDEVYQDDLLLSYNV